MLVCLVLGMVVHLEKNVLVFFQNVLVFFKNVLVFWEDVILVVFRQKKYSRIVCRALTVLLYS